MDIDHGVAFYLLVQLGFYHIVFTQGYTGVLKHFGNGSGGGGNLYGFTIHQHFVIGGHLYFQFLSIR